MTQNRNDSLQQKIFIFTLIIVFIPLVFLGFFSYQKSSNVIFEKLMNTNENMVAQIGMNIEFMFKEFHDLTLFSIQSEQTRQLLTLSDYEDPLIFKEKKRDVEQLLLHLSGSKTFIDRIRIQKGDDVLVTTTLKDESIPENIRTQLDQLNGAPLVVTSTDPAYISYARLMKNIHDLTESLGYIAIDLKIDYLDRLFNSKMVNESDHYFFVAGKDEIVVSESHNPFTSDELKQVFMEREQKSTTEDITIDGKDYIKTAYPLTGLDLSIVHVVSRDELLSKNSFIPSMIIFALVFSLFICTIVAYQFSKYIVRPIHHLQFLMKKVENGNLDVRYDEKGYSEIDMLGKGFNSMLVQLKTLIEMIYVSQIKNKEAELKALYSQINPHFLYNTLDSIYWMGQMENAPKTANMIHSLSKLFRMMLKDIKDVTSMKNELEYASNYLEIQNIRYGNTISFQMDMQNDVFQAKTVKMVLQPLIENAITHGIERKGGEGNIRIQGEKCGNALLITVEDDGIGADPFALNQLLENPHQEDKGMALKNIHDRIRIYSGDGFGLSFVERDGGGLKVIVRQKWEVMEDEVIDRGR